MFCLSECNTAPQMSLYYLFIRTIHFILSYLILSYLILSYLILSYLILSYLILSYRIVSYLILSYRIVSYLILSYLILFYRILSYRIVSYRILSCLIVSYLCTGLSVCRFVQGDVCRKYAHCFVLSTLKSVHCLPPVCFWFIIIIITIQRSY